MLFRSWNQPHNINEHLPVLRTLATECEAVVEIGTRDAVSTTGLLAGQPGSLTTWDIEPSPAAAATTVDLFGKLPIAHGFSAVVRAENMFDAQVMTRNQAGSIDLGTPRTLWVGVRFGG